MELQEKNFIGVKLNGFAMLFLLLALIVIGVLLFVFPVPGVCMALQITVGILLIVTSLILLAGFMEVEPNDSRVMVFFGKYQGTIKENGFFWVHPFFDKRKITLRARNLDVEPIKVNDKVGNPIMIGAVIVWKVKDTYKSNFDIDTSSFENATSGTGTQAVAMSGSSKRMITYENFVRIQSDSALREIAGQYAYDSYEGVGEITLRSGAKEINERLEEELNERLLIAGIEVVESRINYLAYAAEIASVMLRRQQADAIIAAREKIVEGAVSMVDMALKKLEQENIVSLSADKKAEMIGNLLVVLCADESVQPVINTGATK